MWLSLVERCVRDAEAAGSSPVTSTIFCKSSRIGVGFSFCRQKNPDCLRSGFLLCCTLVALKKKRGEDALINWNLSNNLLWSKIIRAWMFFAEKTMPFDNFCNKFTGKHSTYVHIIIIAKMNEEILGNQLQPALFTKTSGNHLANILYAENTCGEA